MWIDLLTPEIACGYLEQTGLSLEPDAICIEPREARWAVHLPENQMSWFAMSEDGHRRLTMERRVLKLLKARCSFAAPRILYESSDGLFDVRATVPGLVKPWEMFDRLRQNPRLAAETGKAIAQILVEQHTQITVQEVSGWLPQRPEWPLTGEKILQQVPQVVDDPILICQIEKLLNWYESVQVGTRERVLTHTDVGLHNLAFDPRTFAVVGIFDYDGATWADRHHDFRYLPFAKHCSTLLDAALAFYEPTVSIALSKQRIYLYNAVCAFSYLAYRLGTAPEEKSCGRTLTEDLDWCCWAIAMVHANG